MPATSMVPPTAVCQKQIEHVVQAEGDEQTLDHTKQEGAEVARAVHQHAQGVDALLDGLPDEEHEDTHQATPGC